LCGAGSIEHLSETSVRNAIILSRWQAQTFEGTDYVDLYDFCNLLHENYDQKKSAPPAATS